VGQAGPGCVGQGFPRGRARTQHTKPRKDERVRVRDETATSAGHGQIAKAPNELKSRGRRPSAYSPPLAWPGSEALVLGSRNTQRADPPGKPSRTISSEPIADSEAVTPSEPPAVSLPFRGFAILPKHSLAAPRLSSSPKPFVVSCFRVLLFRAQDCNLRRTNEFARPHISDRPLFPLSDHFSPIDFSTTRP
jgi:hypothetical protein